MDTSRAAVPEEPVGVVRCWLFLATGITLPFFAFPVASVWGKYLDLATVFAGLFVLSSLSRQTLLPRSRWLRIFFGAAILVPLLVAIPPRPFLFDGRHFFSSYAHWLLVTFFFVSAAALRLSDRQRRNLLAASVTAAVGVSFFALYQLLGIPRGWPATAETLAGFQRRPFIFMRLGSYVRPTSVFLEPSWLGGYLVWNLLLGARLLRLELTRSFWRLFFLAGMAVMILALLATVSWGAYADLAAGAAVFAGLALRHGKKPGRIAWGYAAIVFVILLLAGFSAPGRSVLHAVGARLEWLWRTGASSGWQAKEAWNSSQLRVRDMAHAARLFLDHPLGGIGLGQFAAYPQAHPDFHFSSIDPWCGWVGIAAATGFLGPLVLLAAVFFVLVSWRRRAGRSVDALVPALLAVAVVQQIHTGSFIDLWWWYPLSLAAAWTGAPLASAPHGRDSFAEDLVQINAPTSQGTRP
jgi:hypothetical protein